MISGVTSKSRTNVRYARLLKILEVPPVDTLEYGAVEAIREQLAKRFNVTP